MKRCFAIILGVALIALAWYEFRPGPRREFEEFQENCAKIQIGMTRTDVIHIMRRVEGVFFQRKDSTTQEVWVLLRGRLLSTIPKCVFDSASGKVVKVDCRTD